MPGFFLSIERNQALTTVKSHGEYLIRCSSSKPNCFIVNCVQNNTVAEAFIENIHGKGFKFSQSRDRFFDLLSKVIKHYKDTLYWLKPVSENRSRLTPKTEQDKITLLPKRVRYRICKFLEAKDVLVACTVCKDWTVWASSDRIWKNLCARDFMLISRPSKLQKQRWKKIFLIRGFSLSLLFHSLNSQVYIYRKSKKISCMEV